MSKPEPPEEPETLYCRCSALNDGEPWAGPTCGSCGLPLPPLVDPR